jgi:hypothetical protein
MKDNRASMDESEFIEGTSRSNEDAESITTDVRNQKRNERKKKLEEEARLKLKSNRPLIDFTSSKPSIERKIQ